MLDLCATRWCGQGLGCTEVSGLGSREFRKKTHFHFSLPGFPFHLFLVPPGSPLCFDFTPKKSPSLLSFELKWETTEFRLIFTQCYKSPWADLLHSAGLWRAGKFFSRAGRNIKFRFLLQPQKKRLFTWLHSAAFIWRLELFFRLQPALCQNPGVQNEGFPCFNMGKLTGALTCHHSSWFRKGGEGAVVVVWRQAVLFHCRHFYCAVLRNAVGKAAKADSLGRFCMGPHQLHSLIASLTSSCPEVVPCPQGSLLGITRHLAHLVLFHLASILFSY